MKGILIKGIDKMNYHIFFTTNNKSGWKCRESKLKNNYPEIHIEIVDFINKNYKLKNLPFKQQIWYFINNRTKLILCEECNRPVKYFDINRGYQMFCSVKCSNKNLKKIEKVKQTTFKNYGVEFPIQSKKIKDKIEKTNLRKYGVKNVFQYEEIKKISKQTKLINHGNENFTNPDKAVQTNLKIYGFKHPTQSNKIKKKIKQTKKELYGDENYNNIKKIEETTLNRIGFSTNFKDPKFRKKYNGKTSKIEKEVSDKINGTHKFILKNKEFDIIKDNNIIEVDGDFFHPKKIESLTLIQISTLINDKSKIDIVKNTNNNLYKIHVSNLPKDLTLKNIIKNSYIPDYSISYTQKIISKEYFNNYIRIKGKSKLEKYISLLLKFIRTFHPEFPYPENNDNLNDIINKINKYDLTKIYNKNNNSFNNNCYYLGNGYLKSLFKSYWSCNFKTSESPTQAWNNNTTMKRVIKYRIGCNNSNEIFDFTLKNLIKGLSANRNTISFFKPLLSSSIYKHYLPDNIQNPVVFDPCSGFGGRLLGFKSLFPDGKYIGLEPNNKIYNELNILSSNFNNVELYNIKLEDFNKNINYDIIFTSIPYFDLENYNNDFCYNSFDSWKKEFINKLLNYDRLVINMSEKLCDKLNLNEYIDSYITNNQSHFGNNEKEVIVKLNFS